MTALPAWFCRKCGQSFDTSEEAPRPRLLPDPRAAFHDPTLVDVFADLDALRLEVRALTEESDNQAGDVLRGLTRDLELLDQFLLWMEEHRREPSPRTG